MTSFFYCALCSHILLVCTLVQRTTQPSLWQKIVCWRSLGRVASYDLLSLADDSCLRVYPDVIAWVLDLHLKRRRRTLYTVLVANTTDGALYAQCNAMIYEHNLFRTNLASKWQYVRYLKEQAHVYLTVHFQPKGLLVCVC